MIYTSYFSNLRNIPEDVVPVAISRTQPQGFKGKVLIDLAPTWNTLSAYKRTNDWNSYVKEFITTLNKIDVAFLVARLLEISAGHDVVLLCWEGKGKNCHRHLVSKWLNDHGYECQEW